MIWSLGVSADDHVIYLHADPVQFDTRSFFPLLMCCLIVTDVTWFMQGDVCLPPARQSKIPYICTANIQLQHKHKIIVLAPVAAIQRAPGACGSTVIELVSWPNEAAHAGQTLK